MKPVVLVNLGGGSADRDAPQRIRKAFADRALGVDVKPVPPEKLAELVDDAVKNGATAVIAAGGDGTMSAVAGALAGTDVPMGIIPMGTLNHFARDLGIPDDLDEAAAIIGANHLARVDVGEVNGKTFINNCAIGIYPHIVAERERAQVRFDRPKATAMFFAALRNFTHLKHERLRLTVKGHKELIETPLLFVGNNAYRFDAGAPGQRERLDGGFLSVMAMRSESRLGMVVSAIRALAGSMPDDAFLHLERVGALQVETAKRSLAVGIDGEVAMLAQPLEFNIRKRALKVIVPA